MSFINILHKIYPTVKQEKFLNDCLWSAIGIENWAIQQIRDELDDNYFPLRFMKPLQLRSILGSKIKGHSKRCDLPSRLFVDCIGSVLETLNRHKNVEKLHFKSARKKKSFFFKGDIHFDRKTRLKLPGLKTTIKISEPGKFTGKLKKVTLIKKFNGWYAACCYEQSRKPIQPIDGEEVGVDPGLKSALTFSNGETIQFPRWYQTEQEKISKQQRKSKNSKKVKRLHKKLANKRKDHHHKLSIDLSKRYVKIYWSNDNFKNLSKKFGKSYSNLGLGMFRDLLKNKLASRTDGFGELIEVTNKYSTRTCSSCGALSGPKGWNGLDVREWVCSECGDTHDRDRNAAINTLFLGQGMSSGKGNQVNHKKDFVC